MMMMMTVPWIDEMRLTMKDAGIVLNGIGEPEILDRLTAWRIDSERESPTLENMMTVSGESWRQTSMHNGDETEMDRRRQQSGGVTTYNGGR